MINKLLHHERRISPLGFFLGVAVILLGTAVIILVTLALRTASRSEVRAQSAIDTERSVLTAIVLGCHSRRAYDDQFIEATKADLASYTDSLANAESTAQLPLIQNSPELKAAETESIRILKAAIVSKTKIVQHGPINNCPKYEKLLADLPDK